MDRMNFSNLHVINVKYELRERHVYEYRDALNNVSLRVVLKHYVIV